jgi:hypothetical protein
MITVAFDFETWPIGPGENVLPPAVCLAIASREHQYLEHHDGVYHRERNGVWTYLLGDNDKDLIHIVLHDLLRNPDVHLIGARTHYDLGVATYDFPSLLPHIFTAGNAGRLHDVQIVEKLFSLSTTGILEAYQLPDGSWKEKTYGLDVLEEKYLGIDRSHLKAKAKVGEVSDAWRLNYHALSGMPADEYPDEPLHYALDDAENTLRVWEEQQKVRTEAFHGSANTEEMQCLADYCLGLATAYGLGVDQEQVERLDEAVMSMLTPEKHQPLYDAGLLRPAQSERERKTKKGKTMLHKQGPKKGQPIIVAGKAESVDTKAVQAHVAALCEALEMEAKLTKTGRICTDADVLKLLEPLDPTGLLSVYATRQKYIKIKSTYLPVLRGNERVYPGYSIVKSTGRTSSVGSKLYPSCNIQNIPRIEDGNLNVRACFVPNPGTVYCSIDFSALELCALAQTLYDIFGWSTLRDKINAGMDPHAYLGAQLAAHLCPEFREALFTEQIEDRDEVHDAFLLLKGTDIGGEIFKKYRTFAKPTGLGYPGGLGPDTFIEFARTTYGVTIPDRDTAVTLKNLWLSTFPETQDYLNVWVPAQEDAHNAGDEMGGLCYTSPLGMFRANANYCATANGRALQTPAAEGCKLAIIDCMERCLNPEREDPLLGSMLPVFVHDECIFELPRDRARELGEHAARCMIEAMQVVLPDVLIKAAPAYMLRWLKGAEGTDVLWDMKDGEMFSVPLEGD